MELCSVNHELLEGIPTNLYITSDPTGTIVYEEAVAEVRKAAALLLKESDKLSILQSKAWPPQHLDDQNTCPWSHYGNCGVHTFKPQKSGYPFN